MAKILVKDSRKYKDEQRASRLVKITREQLGDLFRVKNSETYHINIHSLARENALLINLVDNTINVSNQRYLERAVRLAEAYKKAGEPEFSVRKDYERPQ